MFPKIYTLPSRSNHKKYRIKCTKTFQYPVSIFNDYSTGLVLGCSPDPVLV